jgi:hypothetical protein
VEIQVSANVISGKNFSWNTSFNIAFNKNKIENLGLDATGQLQKSYLETSGWVSATYQDFLVEVGQPIGQFYGYVTDGFYTVDDFNYNATTQVYTLKDGIPNSQDIALGNRAPQPGDLKLKKLTNTADMRISAADRTVLGNAQPKFIGGFNQQFSWKGFDASIFMNFSVGNKVYNANKIEFTTQYLYKDNNMLALMNDRWKWYDDNGVKVNDPAQLSKLNANTKYWTPPGGQYFLHSFAIEDGSFLRISNITLGYSVPRELLKKTKILSQFRVYATVNNVATITGYSGFDPEASTRRGNTLTPGVDYAAYPTQQVYTGRYQCYFLNFQRSVIMKNINSTIIATVGLTAALAFTSCKKYLDVENPSTLSQDAVFSSVSYTNSTVIAVYNKLMGDNGYGSRISLLYPMAADDFKTSGDFNPLDRRGLSGYGASPDNTELDAPFSQLYNGIERANICIKYIPLSKPYTSGSDADKKTMRKLYGEVLTLRAQFYYELIRNWGDLPAQFHHHQIYPISTFPKQTVILCMMCC